MNCERVRERMIEWLDGRIDPATANELKAHLDDCPACRQELAQMRQTVALLDMPPDVRPSPALRRGVLAAIEAEKDDARKAPSFAHTSADRAAAAQDGARPPGALVRARSFGNAWTALAATLGGCALLTLGFFVGRHSAASNPSAAPATRQDLAALQSQMDTVGQLVNLTLQRQQNVSTNQRLEDVLSTAAVRRPDRSTIDSLIGTVALDPSANVRLSAVQALYAHADQEVVRTALEVSLPREPNPVVQLAMIDFLTAAKDHDARPVFEKLNDSDVADPNVRQAASRAITQL